MGAIMIKCPVTRRPFATGMTAERESFARSPVFFARSKCPHCGGVHEWFAKEAWVDEAARLRSEAA